MKMLLDVAFDELLLEVVRLGVFEFNEPAIALYAGSASSTTAAMAALRRGRFWDVNAMSLDRATFARLQHASNGASRSARHSLRAPPMSRPAPVPTTAPMTRPLPRR